MAPKHSLVFFYIISEFGSFEVNVTKDNQKPVLLYSGLKDGKIQQDDIEELAKQIHELWNLIKIHMIWEEN